MLYIVSRSVAGIHALLEGDGAYALVRKHHGYIYLKDAIKDEQAFISGE